MITFTDPVNTIPPLCEDDINTKYILSIYIPHDMTSIWIAFSNLETNGVGWSSISAVRNGCAVLYSKSHLIDILIYDYKKNCGNDVIKPYYVVVEPNEIIEFLSTFNDIVLKNFKAFLELHPSAPDSNSLLRQFRDRNIWSSA